MITIVNTRGQVAGRDAQRERQDSDLADERDGQPDR
jgi:hypothetical protein